MLIHCKSVYTRAGDYDQHSLVLTNYSVYSYLYQVNNISIVWWTNHYKKISNNICIVDYQIGSMRIISNDNIL